MKNPPSKKVPLTEQVEQVLAARSQGRNNPLGGKISTEEALSKEFEVSRATIRAALNALTANHFIVQQYCVGFDRK
jgi:DNA-binding GntR family transcriptional regulator